jgi:hypothetical protein
MNPTTEAVVALPRDLTTEWAVRNKPIVVEKVLTGLDVSPIGLLGFELLGSDD